MKRLTVTALAIALLAVPALASTATAGTPRCNGVKATIVGNDKNNLIRGTNGRDVIVAKGGADKIYGRGGNDLICAGSGRDIVIAGDGNDKVFGGDGGDKLKGGAGYDVLKGGPKADGCYVNAGGGKTVGCEEADLAVSVKAPTAVVDGELWTMTVRAKNVGGKPLTGVEVELAYAETDVTCRGVDDISGTESIGYLKPRQWVRYDWTNDCGVPPSGSGEVTLSAEGSSTSAGDDPANDDADVVVTITEAP
jgi:Ca2+-binding RTX toxin-like protein